MDKIRALLSDMFFNYLSDLYVDPMKEYCFEHFHKSLEQVINDYSTTAPDSVYSGLVQFYDDLKSPDCSITLLFDIYELLDDIGGY